jgi:hypothetical protein
VTNPVALGLGLLGAMIAVGLWIVGRFGQHGNAARRLRAVRKTTRVADAAHGDVVKLSGVARAVGATVRLESEFSKEDLLYYRFWAHYWKTEASTIDVGSGSTDVVMGSARDAAPFFLDDGTGSILIDSHDQDVDFLLPPKGHGQWPTLDLFPKNVSPSGHRWVSNETPPQALTYEQETLAPGETITVVGCVDRFEKAAVAPVTLRKPGHDVPILVTTFDEKALGAWRLGCSLVALCLFLLCAAVVVWAVWR